MMTFPTRAYWIDSTFNDAINGLCDDYTNNPYIHLLVLKRLKHDLKKRLKTKLDKRTRRLEEGDLEACKEVTKCFWEAHTRFDVFMYECITSRFDICSVVGHLNLDYFGGWGECYTIDFRAELYNETNIDQI